MKKKLFAVFIAILSVGLLSSCSDEDNPVADQMGHFEAVGIRITQSGAVVLDYFGPDYPANSGAIDKTITLSQGTNPHWDAKFYDEGRNIIEPPDDSDKSFSALFSDPSVASIWWHEGEEGSFEFHLKGLKEGETTVQFQVLHNDHADFSTLPIPVVVTGEVKSEPYRVELVDEESGTLLAEAHLADDGEVEGEITLAANETTDHIEAAFYDLSGNQIVPPVPPHALRVDVSNTSVVEVTGQEEDEPWAFKLQAKAVGSATIEVIIMHDGAVGKRFSPIPVTVSSGK